MPSLLLLLLLLLLLPHPSSTASAPYAQGNLAVVFDAKVGRTSDSHPQLANLTDLWCQATTGEGANADRLPIAEAHFSHVIPPPVRRRAAVVSDDRAYLHFGTASTSAIGKYRCEITTEGGEYVQGNMYVYSRPLFYVNNSMRLDLPDEEEKFKFTGSIHRVMRGETARLLCPAIGYPIPDIVWEKDLRQIAPDDKYVLVGSQLHIADAQESDEGVYRCLASNQFPLEVDGPDQLFELQLDQQLVVSNMWDWIIPLIIIVLILLALLIVIYGCSAWKTHKHNQYNVAKREKKLRRAEDQNLQDPDLEDGD